jgi:hypothetical protein
MKKNIGLLALAGVGLSGPTLLAHAAGFGQTNDHVYIETNIKTPNGNSIAGFARSFNGQLEPIPGSPFLTGGAGTQYAGVDVGPGDPDQDVISNPEHTLLFAVNSGSDTIAVFHIQGNGALTPAEGSPFPSGGNDPVSQPRAEWQYSVRREQERRFRPYHCDSSQLHDISGGTRRKADAYIRQNKRHDKGISVHSLGSCRSVSESGISRSQHQPALGADFLGGLIQRFQYDWNGGLRQLPPLALPASEFSDTTTGRYPLGLEQNRGEILGKKIQLQLSLPEQLS